MTDPIPYRQDDDDDDDDRARADLGRAPPPPPSRGDPNVRRVLLLLIITSSSGPGRVPRTPTGARLPLSPYRVLGVAPDATSPEIKLAYRKLVRTTHPDVCDDADAAATFRRVNGAYEIVGADAAFGGRGSTAATIGSRWTTGGCRSSEGWRFRRRLV